MSKWEFLQMTDKITAILRDFQYDSPDGFGQPFVSPCQIAITFAERFPEDMSKLNLPLGGAEVGEHDSLAHYIARELSKGIHDRNDNQKITHIEGVWLHGK